MADTVTFANGPLGARRISGDHSVSLRRLWTDEWTTVAYTNAHCVDCTWSAAPTMPTATVVWPYGWIKSHAVNFYDRAVKLDVDRWYIKITFTTAPIPEGAPDTVTWYGVVADVEDQQAGFVQPTGSVTEIPSGQQILRCYGMEHLLNQSTINSSWCDNGEAALHQSPVPITFNKDGFGNRSTVKKPGAYAFEGTDVDPSQSHFWSTLNIVEYLLEFQSPSASTLFRVPIVPFLIYNSERLPENDRPILSQEGTTALRLLHQLMDRRRLYSFRVFVEENDIVDLVWLEPFTFTSTPIELGLPDVDNIPANLEHKYIVYEDDALTVVDLREVDIKKVDRIIARGARRTTTCTMFEHVDRFGPAWTGGDELAYDAGASGETGYAGWDSNKKRQRNQEVRSHEALRSVYSWFEIPATWDGDVGYYDSDTLDFFAFVEEDGFTKADQYIHEVSIEPYLPLYEGVDYSGTITPSTHLPSERRITYRRPFVVFKRPSDDLYVIGHKIALLADMVGDCCHNDRWSAYVRTQPSSRILEVTVSGEPQHVIANDDFDGEDDDRDPGDYDYKDRKMLATIALRECRYAEGSFPAPGAADSTLIDAQRAMVIWAGEAYRRDYIVSGTIVDVDDSGTPSTTVGGAYIRDDTDRLKAIAQIAYNWYQVGRYVFTLTTYRMTDELTVGDMVLGVGDSTMAPYTHYKEVLTPITSIRIRNPRIQENSTAEPSMAFTTDSGELDPLTIVPPLSKRPGGRLGSSGGSSTTTPAGHTAGPGGSAHAPAF